MALPAEVRRTLRFFAALRTLAALMVAVGLIAGGAVARHASRHHGGDLFMAVTGALQLAAGGVALWHAGRRYRYWRAL